VGRSGIILFCCVLGLIGALGSSCRRQPSAVNPTTSPATVIPAAATTTAASASSDGQFNRSPKRIELSANEVRLPIELVSGLPIIWFKSADGTRRRLILDTGSDSVLMTGGLVAAERFIVRPSNRIHSDPSGSGTGRPSAAVPTLDLGLVRFKDFDADVAPHLFAGADALLGWPLFRELLVTIDYPQRTLVLRRGELPPPDGKRVVPLRFDDDHLMVQATLADRTLWMSLDTGWAEGGDLALSAALSAETAWAFAPVRTMSTKTAEGASPQKLGRLKGDLILGGYRIVQPVAGTSGWGGISIIGAQALANFVVTLDLRNMRAKFERPTDEPIPSRPVFVAGFSCDLTRQPLTVIEVLPGSAAELAGLRAGDVLLTVDGRPALDGLLSHTSQDDFVMELQRGGQSSTLKVPVTKLVP
jgi:hypothetical protein